MREESVKIYQFNELSDSAKETARDEYRNIGMQYTWWDCAINDVKEIGKLMGIDIDSVYFSGFWSQGDGACFTGEYEYKKGSVKAVKEYAPLDEELHKIAEYLVSIQKRHFYSLYTRVSHSGRYNHEYCTHFDITDHRGVEVPDDTEEALKDALRDYMRWIYKRLESEYEYLTSDAAIDESIEVNQYEFLETGKWYYIPASTAL